MYVSPAIRVTRYVCEKITQNVAQLFFAKNRVEKGSLEMWSTCVLV
jgi:hypothetical protein